MLSILFMKKYDMSQSCLSLGDLPQPGIEPGLCVTDEFFII